MSEASGFYENRKMLKHFKMEASLKRKSESVEVSVERQVVCKHDDENAIVDVYEYRDQPEERKSPNNGGHSVCEGSTQGSAGEERSGNEDQHAGTSAGHKSSRQTSVDSTLKAALDGKEQTSESAFDGPSTLRVNHLHLAQDVHGSVFNRNPRKSTEINVQRAESNGLRDSSPPSWKCRRPRSKSLSSSALNSDTATAECLLSFQTACETRGDGEDQYGCSDSKSLGSQVDRPSSRRKDKKKHGDHGSDSEATMDVDGSTTPLSDTKDEHNDKRSHGSISFCSSASQETDSENTNSGENVIGEHDVKQKQERRKEDNRKSAQRTRERQDAYVKWLEQKLVIMGVRTSGWRGHASSARAVSSLRSAQKMTPEQRVQNNRIAARASKLRMWAYILKLEEQHMMFGIDFERERLQELGPDAVRIGRRPDPDEVRAVVKGCMVPELTRISDGATMRGSFSVYSETTSSNSADTSQPSSGGSGSGSGTGCSHSRTHSLSHSLTHPGVAFPPALPHLDAALPPALYPPPSSAPLPLMAAVVAADDYLMAGTHDAHNHQQPITPTGSASHALSSLYAIPRPPMTHEAPKAEVDLSSAGGGLLPAYSWPGAFNSPLPEVPVVPATVLPSPPAGFGWHEYLGQMSKMGASLPFHPPAPLPNAVPEQSPTQNWWESAQFMQLWMMQQMDQVQRIKPQPRAFAPPAPVDAQLAAALWPMSNPAMNPAMNPANHFWWAQGPGGVPGIAAPTGPYYWGEVLATGPGGNAGGEESRMGAAVKAEGASRVETRAY